MSHKAETPNTIMHMGKDNRVELYNAAKEAYYNSGEELMPDYEFDELERELGLENKSEVGAASRNASYTVKHPYVMGTLSKVQIHKGKDGNVSWQQYFEEAKKWFGDNKLIITPKYDGCSYECVMSHGKIMSVSSRGDSEFGRDLMMHLKKKLEPIAMVSEPYGELVVRGEVLVKKSLFASKWQGKFTNPRSFVSGILNSDYDGSLDGALSDLDIVAYDIRHVDGDGTVNDNDFTWYLGKCSSCSAFSDILPKMYKQGVVINNGDDFRAVYEEFDNYRRETDYALDGIVIKPVAECRVCNTQLRRPTDCVAIKFIPVLEETEVTNITWQLGKTREMTPIVWVKPVVMDGKNVQKCSGHNYGWLVSKKVSIGSRVVLSLAGDIIPFLYKVTDTSQFSVGKLCLPYGTHVENGIHLVKELTEREAAKLAFTNSAQSLQVAGIGAETADKVFEWLHSQDETTMEFFGGDVQKFKKNILECTPEEVYFGCGGGKSGQKAEKEFKKLLSSLTLADIIKSLSLKMCADKAAEQCASYLIGGDADFSHLPAVGYEWVMDSKSAEMEILNTVLESVGKTIDDFKQHYIEKQSVDSEKTPIIMTGEPNGYRSKGEFLQLHPEYRNTGSWKEVKIVFTNSMDSNTGKMKKAREHGIEIRLY